MFATDSFSNDKDVVCVQTTVGVTRRLSKKELKRVVGKKMILWDAKKNYNYLKITKDDRILAGCGGRKVSKKRRYALNRVHVKAIRKFLYSVGVRAPLDYAWSAAMGMTKDFVPKVMFDRDRVYVLAPAGLPDATVTAQYVVNKLFGNRTRLDEIFLK